MAKIHKSIYWEIVCGTDLKDTRNAPMYHGKNFSTKEAAVEAVKNEYRNMTGEYAEYWRKIPAAVRRVSVTISNFELID